MLESELAKNTNVAIAVYDIDSKKLAFVFRSAACAAAHLLTLGATTNAGQKILYRAYAKKRMHSDALGREFAIRLATIEQIEKLAGAWVSMHNGFDIKIAPAYKNVLHFNVTQQYNPKLKKGIKSVDDIIKHRTKKDKPQKVNEFYLFEFKKSINTYADAHRNTKTIHGTINRRTTLCGREINNNNISSELTNLGITCRHCITHTATTEKEAHKQAVEFINGL